MKIYSIYDKATEKYGSYFFAENDNVAIRQFKLGMKNIPVEVVCDLALYFHGVISEDGYVSSTLSVPTIVYVMDSNSVPTVDLSEDKEGN